MEGMDQRDSLGLYNWPIRVTTTSVNRLTLMPECRCWTEAVEYRQKWLCQTDFFPAFRHFLSVMWKSRVYPFPLPAIWKCRMYPFYCHQYGGAGCIPFHCQQYGRAECIPFKTQLYSMDVQGVSLSTATSMDVQGVSFPPRAIWACSRVQRI